MRRSVRLTLLLLTVFCSAWLAARSLRSAPATRPASAADAPAPAALSGPFPEPYDSEPDKSGPMPAAEAAAKMRLPDGFHASVFASEPDVRNPIAMAWDGHGRLWVAENYTYAERAKRFDLNLRDRILVFEDRNGDGHFSSRRVFTDRVQMLTSIEPGRGGVWAMCPPRLMFIPFVKGADGEESAGEPQVLLDGFEPPAQNYHNFANGLRFGPDGWLYGRCGHSAPGEIGEPGTPAQQRVPLRGTIWRYQPQRKVFEALSAGTTNPWGHDWDEHGELFFVNTVNGHLWHEIPGAHYMVTGGNAHTYALIDQHADHWHFDTSHDWTKSRNGAADAYGGGHAHVGAMIYLGDNWPAEYRGHLFTFNLHGFRANQEVLERSGSGYVGHHGADCLFMADKWFRGIDLAYGPDGGVLALDWSDTGECHESTGVSRRTGRIYKITYGTAKPVEVGDLAKLDTGALVKLHKHANEWWARRARRELADRSASGADMKEAAGQLRELLDHDPDVVVKLRALWSLNVIGSADEALLRSLLRHDNEHLRTWAIRLLTDGWPLDTALSARPAARPEADTAALLPLLVERAREDGSGLVRLVLASTLQRLPIDRRPALAAELVAHKVDAHDHNLPLLIWYGLLPVADREPAALAKLAAKCELPDTRRFIARRLAEDIEKRPAPLNELLTLAAEGTEGKSSDSRDDVVAGVAEALKGWRKARKPAAWDALARAVAGSGSEAARAHVRDLGVLFGDARAVEELKKAALDGGGSLASRQSALQALVDCRAEGLRGACEQLLKTPGLAGVAARGLATFDDPAAADALVSAYGGLDVADRPQVIAALASRPAFATRLLEAVEAGKVPRADVTPFFARQIRSLNDAALTKRLTAVWGEVRETGQDQRKRIAQWKAKLTPAVLARADKQQGRQQFAKTCGVCHTLYGEGGKIGPDLTGSNRDNLDYLLENVVDPSAVVPSEYRMAVVNLKDGRVLTGIVSATDRTITVRQVTEVTTVERSEVEGMKESAQSIMPEGLLDALGDTGTRDLIAYLMDKHASHD